MPAVVICVIMKAKSAQKGSIMDNKAYKAARMQSLDGVQLNDNSYNLVIGLVLLWGIIINIVMAKYFMVQIMSMNIIAVLLIYFIGSFGCIFLVYKSNNPAVSFLGFTGLAICMGLILTFCISAYTPGQVLRAFLITAIVTVIMILVSSIFPKFFLSIGRGLLIGLIASIVIEVLGMLIFKWSMNFMDYIVALIFCGFIGFDWARAQVFPKTLDNAVDSAADIYVDVANLFIRILAITGKSSD